MARPRLTAQIAQIYVRQDEVHLKLDVPNESSPQDGLFTLRPDRPNHNAMYSLALAAAANRWPITVKVEGDELDPDKPAFVDYLQVNWVAGQDDG